MKKTMVNKEKLSSIVILILVIILIIGFFYIAKLFSGEGGITSEKPIVFCVPEDAPPDQQKCFYTAHDHFQLKLVLDGKEQDIGFEEGGLEKSHTHAEENKIHWHSTLPVDPSTKQVTDWSTHSIRATLQESGFIYPDKKVTVIVNSQVKEEGLDYIWKDGDTIEVRVG